MSEKKAVIKNADMSEDMQSDVVECATQALEKYNIEKDIAAYIKKEFDKKYSPTWHCIVGRNFGSYVTHETKHFIYFYLGQVAILLFKSGWVTKRKEKKNKKYRKKITKVARNYDDNEPFSFACSFIYQIPIFMFKQKNLRKFCPSLFYTYVVF